MEWNTGGEGRNKCDLCGEYKATRWIHRILKTHKDRVLPGFGGDHLDVCESCVCINTLPNWCPCWCNIEEAGD